MSSVAYLAVVEPSNPDWGKAGPGALLLLLIFVAVCFFLFRSMIRRIRKVPPTFDGAQVAPPQRLGTARPVIPARTTDDAYVAGNAPPPRLGTPTDVLASEKAKRQERIRKAKERRGK